MIAASKQVQARIRRESQTLCERILFVAGDAVCYRLLERPPQYLVECVAGKEQVLEPLGQRFPFAAHTFALLVEGEALPCTVADILEELMDEN